MQVEIEGILYNGHRITRRVSEDMMLKKFNMYLALNFDSNAALDSAIKDFLPKHDYANFYVKNFDLHK